MKYFFLLFSLGLTSLFAKIEILKLGNHGAVRYISSGDTLYKIQRVSSSNEVIYTHEYFYDKNGKLFKEQLLDAFGSVVCSNQFRDIDRNSILNPKRNKPYTKYDLEGNLTWLGEKKLIYDDKKHLIKVVTPQHTIEYSYDTSGKRLSRSVNGIIEYFIYFGTNELAVVNSKGKLIELRVPGLSFHKNIFRPIAIETSDTFFAPILNAQGSCIKLINIETKEEIALEFIDIYGKGLNQNIPSSWIFAGKHYDRQAGLVYFGTRYYSPELEAWITPDPLNQSKDPYLFCLGNPTEYIDPDGLWAIAVPILQFALGAGATLTSPVWLPISAGTAAGVAIGYWLLAIGVIKPLKGRITSLLLTC